MDGFSMGLLTVNGYVPKDQSFSTSHTGFGYLIRRLQVEKGILPDVTIALNTIKSPSDGFFTTRKPGRYVLIGIHKHDRMIDFYCYFTKYGIGEVPAGNKTNLSGKSDAIRLTCRMNYDAKEQSFEEDEILAEELLDDIANSLKRIGEVSHGTE